MALCMFMLIDLTTFTTCIVTIKFFLIYIQAADQIVRFISAAEGQIIYSLSFNLIETHSMRLSRLYLAIPYSYINARI